VKLSVKKLRRSTTVIGGTFLGLGIAAAMATPALACHPDIQPVTSCVNSDGSWVVQWKITPSDGPNVPGHVSQVVAKPAGTLTGIHGDDGDTPGSPFPAEGTQTLSKNVNVAKITVTGVFQTANRTITDTETGKAHKPTDKCTPTDTDTPPTDTDTPPTDQTPPVVPTKDVDFVSNDTCTTLTVGIEVPKTNKDSETATFTPSTGESKTVTAKPGETKTVDFPASKNLSVKGSVASAPDKDSTIKYAAPKDCTSSSSPAATPSTTPGALAITGSSSTPIAAGAVALVLVGGGAFFVARRRKMKFTA
jgi:LPXTG-motif cell wall-anchored protein